MKLTKIIILIFSCAVLLRIIILLGEPWQSGSANRGLVASEKMARLIAFINLEKQEGQPIDFAQSKLRFTYSIGVISDSFFSDIEFAAIPDSERLERMPSVDYYLFSRAAGVGLLCNGKLFYGPFSKARLDHTSMAQDITTKMSLKSPN